MNEAKVRSMLEHAVDYKKNKLLNFFLTRVNFNLQVAANLGNNVW